VHNSMDSKGKWMIVGRGDGRGCGCSYVCKDDLACRVTAD